MSRPDPAAALNGVGTGHLCDRCNQRIQHGDKAAMYVTWYDEGGWTPRRTWCLDCCPKTIDKPTEETDEAVLIGVFFAHRLIGLSVRNRVRPKNTNIV